MHRYQGNVSFRQIAVHMISRCLAKCYRFFLPRKMRDPLRRYRQVYLSILLFALFNIAFWAGFLSSRLSYEQRTTDLSDVHTLSEGQSKQEDLQILRKQWEMNNRRKLDNLKFHKRKRKLKYKYYDGANPTGSSGEQRDGGQSRNNEVNPSIEQMQGEITNAWITNVPIYTKGKFWDKVSKESKTNAPVSIEDRFKNFDKENSIFTNNDIREKNDEGAFSLPSQKAKVKVSPIEERQSIDDDKSRRESITEGDDEENVQIHEFKVKNTQHEKQTVSETIDETKEERQEYSRTDDNAVEIKSAFPSYTTNPPQPASKDEKKEDERSVKDETEDQKDESENDKGVKSVITSYATDFRRPQSDDNERKENESPAADETEDEEDETDEEVSPLTSVRQKDGTVFSHEEMQHKREQLQKNESLSDTKQVEDQDDIQRRNEVDRESQPDTVQNRTQHQSHTDKSEGDDGSKSLTTVNHDHHEAAVNEDTRRVNHDYKDDQQEKNSKDSTEENKGGNGNVHGQESNPMDNRKRKTKDNEDETKESEDNDEHNENPQKADDVSKQKRDIDQRQRKDKNEVTDNEDARGEMQGKEMQGKEQQSMTEEETRKQHAQHQQQPEQQEKTQQQLQQQQQQFHHHHQQQQFHQQQQLQQQLHQQQQHQQLHQQQQQRLQQQQPLQQQLHQQQEQKQLHQQQQQQQLHQQQQQPLQQQQPHQQKEQQQPFQQDQQQVHQQEQQQQVHQQQQSLLHRQQLQQQQVQLQIQQQQKQLQQQQPHQQLQPQQLQRQQQKQHKEGSDNNGSERQTETDKQRNGNQVKGQEESNDLKARESKREKQSRNPSERQEIEKEEEKRQPVKEKQQNRKPSERQEKVEEEEARKQEKQEQQNRKPSERQEKTAKLEEEGRQQANEEKQNENLQQERKVASKERTQAQEDKRLNHENSDENIERNQQEEEQSRKRGRGSESLKRRENEKNANQETGRKDESSLQHPLMPSATKKTGILKQLPLIDMEDLEDKRPKVLIVIFVLSSALRYDRRQAIRDSWWTKCKEPQAACMFVTDGYIDETLHDGLLKEKQAYNDILFLPVDEGLNFGMRLLFLMEWVQAKYNPEFFLRIDDDYFLCIERLLHELPQRPKTNLVWGFWHCDLTTVVFIDESFILLSYDLVEKFLSWDEKTLLCHPFGDQQLGIWLNSVPTFKGFFDARLHHDPPASKNSTIRNLNNICDRFLGLHGTYPEDMRRFWLRGNDGKKTVTKLYPLYPNACHYRPYFKWQDIKPSFRYKPELCNKNPRWENKREMWTGRQ